MLKKLSLTVVILSPAAGMSPTAQPEHLLRLEPAPWRYMDGAARFSARRFALSCRLPAPRLKAAVHIPVLLRF
jgi:hypothetical protein